MCSKILPSILVHFSTLLAIVRVDLPRSSWRSCFMRAALFIMRVTYSFLVFTFSLQTSLFIHPHRQKSDLYAPTSNSHIFTLTKTWTHVYMNLFTRNIPYYHLLKYLLVLLKHPVYTSDQVQSASCNCHVVFKYICGSLIAKKVNILCK